MSYESIQIDKSHIIWETAKGTLVLLPKKCKYGGYQFWIFSSFVKEGSTPKTAIISFRDDFKFKLEKYRRISHDKKELVDTVFVPAIELKEMFGITEQQDANSITSQADVIEAEIHKKNKLIRQLDNAELFLRNRAHSEPAPLNEYDIGILLDISNLLSSIADSMKSGSIIILPCKTLEQCKEHDNE